MAHTECDEFSLNSKGEKQGVTSCVPDSKVIVLTSTEAFAGVRQVAFATCFCVFSPQYILNLTPYSYSVHMYKIKMSTVMVNLALKL